MLGDYAVLAYRCAGCELFVHYGYLYAGIQVCAEQPDLDCAEGTVPTFVLEHEEWSCQPTCNNTLYDQVSFEGERIRVPC